jgi:hypothetical protein
LQQGNTVPEPPLAAGAGTAPGWSPGPPRVGGCRRHRSVERDRGPGIHQ